MDYRIIGALLNSALYLSFVTWTGVTTGRQTAAYVAIAAMGVTYLGYIVQIAMPERKAYANGAVTVSICLAIVAGLLLLV